MVSFAAWSLVSWVATASPLDRGEVAVEFENSYAPSNEKPEPASLGAKSVHRHAEGLDSVIGVCSAFLEPPQWCVKHLAEKITTIAQYPRSLSKMRSVRVLQRMGKIELFKALARSAREAEARAVLQDVISIRPLDREEQQRLGPEESELAGEVEGLVKSRPLGTLEVECSTPCSVLVNDSLVEQSLALPFGTYSVVISDLDEPSNQKERRVTLNPTRRLMRLEFGGVETQKGRRERTKAQNAKSPSLALAKSTNESRSAQGSPALVHPSKLEDRHFQVTPKDSNRFENPLSRNRPDEDPAVMPTRRSGQAMAQAGVYFTSYGVGLMAMSSLLRVRCSEEPDKKVCDPNATLIAGVAGLINVVVGVPLIIRGNRRFNNPERWLNGRSRRRAKMLKRAASKSSLRSVAHLDSQVVVDRGRRYARVAKILLISAGLTGAAAMTFGPYVPRGAQVTLHLAGWGMLGTGIGFAVAGKRRQFSPGRYLAGTKVSVVPACSPGSAGQAWKAGLTVLGRF